MDNKPLPHAAEPYLARLDLTEPRTLKEKMIRKMIVAELIAEGVMCDAVRGFRVQVSG